MCCRGTVIISSAINLTEQEEKGKETACLHSIIESKDLQRNRVRSQKHKDRTTAFHVYKDFQIQKL